MKRYLMILALLGLAACGIDGPPVAPGSGEDPRIMEPDTDDFFM
ncbi:MAG: hypothetical protein AAF748_02360 [Pseudomonadota bacterium]